MNYEIAKTMAATTLLASIALGSTSANAVPFVSTASLGGVVTPWGPNDDCTFPGTSSDVFTGTCVPGVAQSLGFTLNFFGTNYTDAFINNNGNITFGSALPTFTPFGLTTTTGIPIIAPYFGDVDTRGTDGTGAGNNVVDFTNSGATYNGRTAFGVEWPGVGYYANHVDLLNTFELIITDRSDIAAGDADIYFNYGSIQWETGDASGGVGGTGGECAHAGFSNGSGNPGTNFEIPGSGICGSFTDAGSSPLIMTSNDGIPGQWLFQVRNGSVIVPPEDVPEPTTLSLLAAGLIAAGVLRRRRQR